MRNSLRQWKALGVAYRCAGCGVLAGMCVAGSVSDAAAQAEPGLELGMGYLVVMGTMPGANAQIGFPLSDRWSLVGELNVASGRECDGCDRRFNDVSVLGGVRANWWPGRQVSVSTQVLAGALHSRGEGYPWTMTFANGRTVGGYEEAFTVNYVAVQPGAGVTLMITPRLGIRLQTDLQVAIPDQNEYDGIAVFPRTVVGGVIRLGPR